MKKVLLTGINAKYIHSNLAIRYLYKYSKAYTDHVQVVEYTINNHYDHVLQEIYRMRPDILTFSCYIWNIEMIKELITDYKKIAPDTTIILGGPEVSYDGEKMLSSYKEVDVIIVGEGEETFQELMAYYIHEEGNLKDIDGIVYRESDTVHTNKPRKPLLMDDLPFVYEDGFEGFDHRIIYYESSRGCPFNCQYCLSSIEKGVRMKSLHHVFKELQQFLDARVMQVKFVDRTFNCHKKHAVGIWTYLHEHDNGYTNFHFEISADLLDEDMIELLRQVRPGLFQLEIGVQSTNETTIHHIQRKTNFLKLAEKVKAIQEGNNIHQHLDLIAGLPDEDYDSFGRSFNDVYALEPHQLQLGFLKILNGSGLKRDAEDFGIIYKEKAPYEVLKTHKLSYDDILRLKMIEEMVEIYYNSGNFYFAIKYIETFFKTPFAFYEALGDYWLDHNLHVSNHNKVTLYTILLEFYKDTIPSNEKEFMHILKFDMYLQEKVKKFPHWLERQEAYKEAVIRFYRDEENTKKYLPHLEQYTAKQKSRMTHLEIFPIDIIKWSKDFKKPLEWRRNAVLFDYHTRDIFRNNATYRTVELIYNISQEM
ncbi:B12-binding domain-containing radical SAM protein [Vallitalea pronyensis]|uniref:B12-binding domain-containing radical SAM protein n=1 Tax=Vallitalea pronyensis TaxID=1348613 RepID=A0A8J8SJ13_9FIRM|nr:B12-binding domain-containing radical SAM protein [Vallitalea pronyensis]QUI25495.1 B12-binding domain-containing radical SAM protein [Vallitalea pronyensis]